jgi:hypothetical protein
MSNLDGPADQTEQEDITDYALEKWGRTIKLCAIRISAAIPAAVSGVVIWLCSRR